MLDAHNIFAAAAIPSIRPALSLASLEIRVTVPAKASRFVPLRERN